MKRLLCFALAIAALSACRGPNSQILVFVEADPGIRRSAVGLHVRIFGSARDDDPESVPNDMVHDVIEMVGDPSEFFPRRYALAPLGGDAERLYLFEATARRGLSEDSLEIVTARVISGYRPGEVAQIWLYLTDECAGVPCDDPRYSCDPQTMMCTLRSRRDPDPIEAGMPDSGVVVEGCTSDADCEDAHECTEDFCFQGQCGQSYAHSACDEGGECGAGRCFNDGCRYALDDSLCMDSVPCTADICTETGCEHRPNNLACTAGPDGECDPVNGCQYSVCSAETCTIENSCQASATCNGDTCERPPRCADCCNGDCSMDDGEICTTDTCGPSGWEHTPNAEPCEDGSTCTVGDFCSGGSCQPGRSACETFNPCTTSTCTDGACTTERPVANGTPCDNSNGCPGDTCQGGVCTDPGSCSFDAGMPIDAGRDAGMDAGRDAGPRDGGYDAGGFDAGRFDAGARPDAGGCTVCPDDGDPCTADFCMGPTCVHMTMAGCVDCGDGTVCGGGTTCCAPGDCCFTGEWCNPDPVPHCQTITMPGCMPPCAPGSQVCCPNGAGGFVCVDGGVCPVMMDGGL